MIQDEQRRAIKNLIDTGNIKQFDEIFLYIKKKQLHERMGINYNRFLRILKNPKKFQFEDAYQVATIFDIDPRQASELIHNQIDNSSKKNVAKKTRGTKKST
ncbi:hypothetical protein [Parafilimonas sp.]|uniref:hypothetical protein n=1 Tax=Parafilimonas sp. TaxID=1969739 RepID=UPI003F8214DB